MDYAIQDVATYEGRFFKKAIKDYFDSSRWASSRADKRAALGHGPLGPSVDPPLGMVDD